MNQRNVDALAEAIERANTALSLSYRGLPEMTPADYERALAALLADSGVLVPAALTDTQATELRSVGMSAAVRSTLERIAKGG